MRPEDERTEELDQEPNEGASDEKPERTGAGSAAEQREAIGREMGGGLDRALRWLAARHPAYYVIAFVVFAVAAFPFDLEANQGFLDAIFSSRPVLWLARMGVMGGVVVSVFFVLRSLAAALEEGRFITGIAGVQLQAQAEKRLRESSEQQRQADAEITRLSERLQETQELAEGLLNERDSLLAQFGKRQDDQADAKSSS